MKERGNILELVVLIFFALAASFPALSAMFYSGVVSETDLSKSIISDNWMGISGIVERGNEQPEGFKVGELNLRPNQIGEEFTVVSSEFMKVDVQVAENRVN